MRISLFIRLLAFFILAVGSAAFAQPDLRQFRNPFIRPAPGAQYPQRSLPPDTQGQGGQGASTQDRQAEQLYRIGRSYIEQGFYSEGLEALNQSLALRPGHPRALTYKGIALRALREPQLALQQFDEALAADPDDGVAHGERGLTYIVLGDTKKAEDDLEKAGRLRPDLVPWFKRQGQWMADNRQSMAGEQTDLAAPGPTPPVVAHEQPVPNTEVDADAADTPGIRARIGETVASLINEAWALVKPAIVAFVGFVILLIVLWVGIALIIWLVRRRSRPWNSGMRRRRSHDGFPDLPYASEVDAAPSHPASAHPASPPVFESQSVRSRTSFFQRRRGLFIAAAVAFAVLAAFALPVLWQAFRLDADKLVAPRERPSVLDYRGNVYTRLGTPDIPIQYTDLPKHLVDALRAREDSRFFEHNGVDWYGLGRAVVKNLSHGRIKQGASTLTMQLVEKVYTLPQDGLLSRVRSKLVEWTMAHRGEAALARKMGDKRAAKEAIMAAYLNRVEFGGGTIGVGAASYYYFDKPVSELTLGESCMLVALLRAPTANSPYRNPDNSRLARDMIVAQMLRRGYITEDQAKQARFYVVDNPKRPAPKHNGYLVAAITREMNALKEEGKLPEDVWDHNSLTIQSTLDLWAQDILDSEIRKVTTSYKGDTEKDPLGGAAMILDNATGQIRALVSGQDYSKSQYDLALVSRRQVASIAKPFVYATYVEQGGDIAALSSNAALTDKETKALDGWNPKNSSSLKTGNHPLATGLAFSDNMITVRVGMTAGLRKVYNTLNAAGLINEKATTGPAWLLGTFESTLADVLAAYTAFPRGGTRVEPYLVQSVSIDGKEVYRAEPQVAQLFSKRTCQQVHRGLREAMTDGTGRRAVSDAGLDASIAGKTGTSQSAADVWWVGYVKDITLGVRFGRDSNASLGNAAGGTMAAPAAARVLKKLSERYELEDAFAATGG